MNAYYDDNRGRYGTGESYDYFWKYEKFCYETDDIFTSSDGLWNYALTDDGIELLRYNGNQIHINIPSFVDNKKVVSLESTFDGFYELKSVTVPDGVMIISGAFYGCEGLEDVSLPTSIRDLTYAFNCCYSLKSLSIPPYVENFSWAFEGTKITSFRFPDNTKNISHSFMGSEHLKSVYIPKSITDSYEAFSDCEALEHVIIEDGVTSVSEYAFYNCISLKELTIPQSVTQFQDKCIGYMEVREYTDADKSAYRIKGEAIVPDFKIKGISGSAVEEYAKNNGIPFISL